MKHQGVRYNVEMLAILETRHDQWGCSHTKQNVIIEDTKTGKRYQYMGRGHDLGNFHPVFINVSHYGRYEVDMILKSKDTLFPVRPHRLVRAA